MATWQEPAQPRRSYSRCRSCRAPIQWASSERGKPIPLDADPYIGDDPRGLFVRRVVDHKTVAVAVTPDAFPDEPVFRSHWSTCPQADQWRRR